MAKGAIGLCLALLAGCGSAQPAGGLGGDGEIEIDLTIVPAGVQCIRLIDTGDTRQTTTLLPTPGPTASLALSGLPTGLVVLAVDAFSIPCASVTSASARSWFAAPVEVTLSPGVLDSITLTMYR